ncbi:MAG: M23 family metallopeptidase [Leptospirales bacterium]|nr:M23 family metallopeptidase [Leptospirales bacterium]
MMFAPTYAQLRNIKLTVIAIASSLLIVFISGNIYNTFIKERIIVNPESYIMKSGYPVFTSEEDYIKLLSAYPLDPGVKIVIHSLQEGETLWNLCRRYKIDTDTIIAANPFLTDLNLAKSRAIVIPLEKGVLFAFNDFLDVRRMAKELKYDDKIMGDYKPRILKIISNDDIRFVFFKNVKPVLLNTKIEKLYVYHRLFEQPLSGKYTSMFGARRHPIFKTGDFHDGIDIQAPYGSPIKAARAGIVSYSGWRDGYGKTVMVMHDNGYITMYAHCSELKVKRGDFVTKDSIIGYVGSTGISTGPHLHFSLIHHGKIIDPIVLLW